MKLENKIAVVTGGNSGIGRAIAEEFASQGAQVVVFGRNQTTLDETVAALGEGHVGIQGDVANLADIDRLFADVKEKFGRVDVLVANAGVAPAAPLEAADEALFDNLFNINVKGLYFTVQKALPLLGEGSSVIFTSSAVTQSAMLGMSLYGATKAAVTYFAKSLGAELLPKGIRVNALSPGAIETPIFGKMGLSEEELNEMAAGIQSQIPIGRFGQANEMAKAALFLASDDSSYVVGSDLLADGGFSL